MQVSELPQTRSAAAIAQARSGGLEQSPNASSRDQAQYWASSKNRSTTENFNPIKRMSVSAPTSPSARPKLGTTRGRLAVSVSAAIGAPKTAGRLDQPQPRDKDAAVCHKLCKSAAPTPAVPS